MSYYWVVCDIVPFVKMLPASLPEWLLVDWDEQSGYLITRSEKEWLLRQWMEKHNLFPLFTSERRNVKTGTSRPPGTVSSLQKLWFSGTLEGYGP